MRDPGLPRARARAGGVLYIMVLMALLIMGIATAVVGPVWHTEVRRDKEAELLFRLNEYRNAIARFRADRGRPPRELKDLLEDRSQLQIRRYLRRLYRDPITGKDDWKLDYVADQTGATLGIADIHSSSEQEPIRNFKGKKTYKDW
jgi:type II secretory pathway pseudopilin PulG